jgi:hypothetical protein
MLFDQGLDIELRFGFELNPNLALIIKRTIEYTIIKVDFQHRVIPSLDSNSATST